MEVEVPEVGGESGQLNVIESEMREGAHVRPVSPSEFYHEFFNSKKNNSSKNNNNSTYCFLSACYVPGILLNAFPASHLIQTLSLLSLSRLANSN